MKGLKDLREEVKGFKDLIVQLPKQECPCTDATTQLKDCLSTADAVKLKDLKNELWERWGIGLGVLFLGLLPSCFEIVDAMWNWTKEDSTAEVLSEEIFTMIGTMFVLVSLVLTDTDLWRWLKPDLIGWVLLAILTLMAQIFGAVVGIQAACRSDHPKKMVYYLVPIVLVIALQVCLCVWASLLLDLTLIWLLYRGHTHLSRKRLPKAGHDLYKQPEDGLTRDPLPEDDYDKDKPT